MIRTPVLMFALAVAAASPALAQTPAEAAAEAAAAFGPEVGTPAPAFSVPDATGAQRSLADLAGEKGLVLYFNRSLDWCPICLRQTIELQASAAAFDAAGWGLAVLTYDSVETLAIAARRRELSVPLLADPDSQVIDAFAVRDPIYADPNHRAHGVPYPIAFAITPDGAVAAKFWHEAGLGDAGGYRTRVTAEDVLAALDGV